MFCLKLLCVSTLMLSVSVQAPQHLMLLGSSQKDERSRRQAKEDKEVENAIMPQPAACIPELRIIRLNTSDDLSVIYYPSCTRIEQCGGCCNTEELYECKPIEQEAVYFKISKKRWSKDGALEDMGYITVKAQRHKKCRCECRQTPSDCTPLQEFNKNSCTCVCSNRDDKQKCLGDSLIKSWNHSKCTCECKNMKDCSTGYFFDSNSCNCMPERLERRDRISKGRTSRLNGR